MRAGAFERCRFEGRQLPGLVRTTSGSTSVRVPQNRASASFARGTYLSLGRSGWKALRMRLLIRSAAGLTCLLLVTGCASETTNTSTSTDFTETTDGTRLIEPGFRTALRVDMRLGTSAADSSALIDEYGRSSGVESISSREGEALVIFSSDATEDDVVEVRQALSKESTVEQVSVEHRK
jgi:hypothetical protein